MSIVTTWLRDICEHPAWRAAAAVLVAVAANVLVLWLLVRINALPTASAEPPPRIRTILINPAASQDLPRQREEPEPEEPEPEPMEVNLDAPVPDQAPLDPLLMPLELPDPTIGPITITTASASKPAAPRAVSAPPRPMDANQVSEPPRELRGNRLPLYPSHMKDRGVEGRVVVKLLIDTNGRVEEVKVVSGEPGFVRAVTSVVRYWRFEPARHDGRPAKVWGVKTFRFQLEP